MPSAVSPNPRAESAQQDELDRLFNDDQAIEQFFQDLPRNDTDTHSQHPEQTRDEDQEVQVKKKRTPIPKLDENRLLSDAGIPKLRKIARSRLKFRGKGHEFSDISNLLNTYQLWLDDLYPRAKFRDAVKMVEKVGHSRRMQVTRRAWLDDTKPYRKELTPPVDATVSGTDSAMPLEDDTLMNDGNSAQNSKNEDDAPRADELDDLMAEERPTNVSTKTRGTSKRSGPFEDEPDDDELDALLAESDASRAVVANSTHEKRARAPFEEDPDDDELEALMAEHDGEPTADHTGAHDANKGGHGDFADDEEAMRDMW